MKYPFLAICLFFSLHVAGQTTVVIQPHFSNGDESDLFSLIPTGSGAYANTEFYIIAWTNSGTPDYNRHVLKFDALTDTSVIPAAARIGSAKLVLFGRPSSSEGNYGNSLYSGTPYPSSNEGWIYPLAAAFDKYTVNWSTQPGILHTDSVATPVSYEQWNQNDTIDVTTLATYLRAHGNLGFMFKLQNESAYRERMWCTSMYADSTKHPLLIVSLCANLITGSPITDSVLVGDTARFFVSTISPLLSYQWQEDPGTGFVDLANVWPYSGVNTDTLIIQDASSYLDATHYRCIVSSDGSCPDTSASVLLVVREPVSTGVNQLTANAVAIYPNPAKNELTVSGDNISTISICNLLGQQSYRRSGCTKKTVIDITTLPAGMYMITVTGMDGVKTVQKIIKE